MFTWSNDFAIGHDDIDFQHRSLFDVLERLSIAIETKTPDERMYRDAIDSLQDYCTTHFEDEERLMAELQVDSRHVRMQRMEHASFAYDIERMKNVGPDDNLRNRMERLVSVTGAWLVFHTLRLDQLLGIQMKEIRQGRSPEEAYDIAMNTNFDARLYRRVVDALIRLWADAALRVHQMEELVWSANAIPDHGATRLGDPPEERLFVIS